MVKYIIFLGVFNILCVTIIHEIVGFRFSVKDEKIIEWQTQQKLTQELKSIIC